VDEGAVDLERVRGEILEIGKGGIAGAEIVEGERNPEFLAFLDDALDVIDVLQRIRFEDFDFQPFRGDIGKAGENWRAGAR